MRQEEAARLPSFWCASKCLRRVVEKGKSFSKRADHVTEPKDRPAPAEIRLLASPVRQEIVDTLEALGGDAPVAAIAGHIGRPSDGLYYNLRILVRGGLLEELPDGGDGKRYRTRAAPADRLRYEPGKTANARAVASVVGGMLRTTRRNFVAALADADVVREEPARRR